MIYLPLILIVFLVGILVGVFYMMYQIHSLKPYEKKVEESQEQLINTLEKNSEFWKTEATNWRCKYWELKLKRR